MDTYNHPTLKHKRLRRDNCDVMADDLSRIRWLELVVARTDGFQPLTNISCMLVCTILVDIIFINQAAEGLWGVAVYIVKLALAGFENVLFHVIWRVGAAHIKNSDLRAFGSVDDLEAEIGRHGWLWLAAIV